jgi:magnesium chelatase family protein
MEDGVVSIVRAGWSVMYPSRFLLVAASNPCGCGYFDDPIKTCTCAAGMISSFRQRLSGPILDRIDLHVEVPRPTRMDLFATADGEGSAKVRERVTAARMTQRHRFRRRAFSTNVEIPTRSLDEICAMTPDARRTLEIAVESFALSARAVHRAMRIARTVADLAGSDVVTQIAIEEAVNFRFEPGRR